MGRKRTYAAAMQLLEDLSGATKVIKEELVDAMVPDIALHRHHYHHHHQHHLHQHSNLLNHTSSSSSSSPSSSSSSSPTPSPSSSFSPTSSSSSSSDFGRTPTSSYDKDCAEVPMLVPSGCAQGSVVVHDPQSQHQRHGASSPSSSSSSSSITIIPSPTASSPNTATVPTTAQHIGCGSTSGDLTPVGVYSSPPTFPQVAAPPPPRPPPASSITSSSTSTSPSSCTSSSSPASSNGARYCGGNSPVGVIVAEKYWLTSMVDQASCLAVDVRTQERFVVKILDGRSGRDLAAQHAYLGTCAGVRAPVEVITSSDWRKAWVAFPAHYDDLHSYVRTKKRLREAEAQRLFAQISDTVARCHEAGLVLRDLKLRKFVFTDTERRELSLESLEDSVLVGEERDDLLEDKHGCPAYVAPEILTSAAYSGRAADMWGLGVMLYTMLVGRYPFHDTDHTMLFAKIRNGHYCVPEWVSSRARHLIHALLRRDPQLRLAAQDVLGHPWLTRPPRDAPPRDPTDHAVPQVSRIPPRLPHAHTKASLSVAPTAPPVSMVSHAPHVPCL